MRHELTIKGFDIRLNQLIDGKVYNYRTKRYLNPVKTRGDNICIKQIRQQLKGVKIRNPCQIHYSFYVKDRWDADGVISAFWKCFLDALQKCEVIENDSYKYIGSPIIDCYEIDKEEPRVEVSIEY